MRVFVLPAVCTALCGTGEARASRVRYTASSFSVLWYYGHSAPATALPCALCVSPCPCLDQAFPRHTAMQRRLGASTPGLVGLPPALLKPWPNCQASWSNEGLCQGIWRMGPSAKIVTYCSPSCGRQRPRCTDSWPWYACLQISHSFVETGPDPAASAASPDFS